MAEAKLDVEELVENTFEKHFGVSLDRLEAICQAEKDGRCVVLAGEVATRKEEND